MRRMPVKRAIPGLSAPGSRLETGDAGTAGNRMAWRSALQAAFDNAWTLSARIAESQEFRK